MIKIKTPLNEELVRSLKAGQAIALSGIIYTARDMAHKRLCDSITAGEQLPINLRNEVIYFVGPTPARPGRVIGSAGPTTSGRMDEFSPILIRAGLKGMIGKGYRTEQLRKALQKYTAVHFTATGGAGALLSRYITAAEVIAYHEIGTEAIRKLTVVDFPLIVAYDSYGNTVYKQEVCK